MNISGRVHEVTAPEEIVTRGGATYKKWQVVVEYNYNTDWPKKVQIEFFTKKDLPRDVDKAVVGSEVSIEADAESRYSEQHDRWFTTVKGWKLDVVLAPMVPSPVTSDTAPSFPPASPTDQQIPF